MSPRADDCISLKVKEVSNFGINPDILSSSDTKSILSYTGYPNDNYGDRNASDLKQYVTPYQIEGGMNNRKFNEEAVSNDQCNLPVKMPEDDADEKSLYGCMLVGENDISNAINMRTSSPKNASIYLSLIPSI
ncbi:hypothetical protein JTB14_038034 [Gonioctena quinquepunctata]|nr:hypothetical protein JTB14_038034 [Gonioctena quinquepunctata]